MWLGGKSGAQVRKQPLRIAQAAMGAGRVKLFTEIEPALIVFKKRGVLKLRENLGRGRE